LLYQLSYRTFAKASARETHLGCLFSVRETHLGYLFLAREARHITSNIFKTPIPFTSTPRASPAEAHRA
jgi:hypothetical protein